MDTNVLYYGDNLVWLRDHKYFPDELVDLIYLDPPFNSNANYNVIFREPGGEQSQAQLQAFDDTWRWDCEASAIALDELSIRSPQIGQFISWLGNQRDRKSKSMAAYLGMMAIRLLEMHRVLKPTGSIYLHCDSTASHYLKVLMDGIFGASNFRNEIIWRRTGAHGAHRSFGPIHDTLLFYTKTNKYYFKIVRRPYMKGHVERRYTQEKNGRLKFTSGGNVLTGAGASRGESGGTWRGFNPTAKNRHWAIPSFLSEQMSPEFQSLGILDKLEVLYRAGLIEIVEGNAWPTPVRFLGPDSGQPIQDIWAYQPYTENTVYNTSEGIDIDVKWLGTTDPERTGYQTQKPLGLLERIIQSSSKKGDVVLDPFCGCGTAVIASQKLGRKWIGIDITHLAVWLIEQRLKDSFGESIKDAYEIHGSPKDIASAQALWNKNKKEFELWALKLVDARPRARDGGVDGLLGFVDEGNKVQTIVVQVKGGESLTPSMIRDLIGTVEKEKAAMGLFVTLHEPQPGTDMISLAIHAGNYKSVLWHKSYPRIQIRTIRELLIDGKEFDLPPRISLLKKAATIRERPQTKPIL